jgi:hypothetical protein
VARARSRWPSRWVCRRGSAWGRQSYTSDKRSGAMTMSVIVSRSSPGFSLVVTLAFVCRRGDGNGGGAASTRRALT